MTHILSLGAINKLTGEYVYPKIANKKDEYICPECNKDLILCQGEIRVHHFRHKVDSINPCQHYSNPTETQIHKDAKILLKNLLERKIPISFIRNCCCCKENEEYEIPEITETSVIQLEYRFDYNGIKIADVAYIDDNEILCIFEIYNTHKTCSENRPEPWFEINAETLIKIANDNNLSSLQIPCIRGEKCDECMERENANLKYYNIEKYVRIKLGQKYPIPDYLENGRVKHLRFDFDAQYGITDNKNIMDLFDEDFINKKVVIHSHEGNINAYIISISLYNKYNYWGESYGDMNFPCEKIIDFTGESTIAIIKILLVKYCSYLLSEKYCEKCDDCIETENISSKNTREITSSINDIKYVYLKIDFSKKGMIKEYGGKWNKEHKLWYITKNIYNKNKNFFDTFGDKIEWIYNDCEHCNGTGYFAGDKCWFC